MALQKFSEYVYVGLCLKLGTSEQVAIRRESKDIGELLENTVFVTTINFYIRRESGSQREGFRLEESDIDFMFWLNDHRVLWDNSQAMLYKTHGYTLFLCDSSDSPPGYTLLKMWIPLEITGDEITMELTHDVISAFVSHKGSLYISSSKYRENTWSQKKSGTMVHGPCSSGMHGTVEYDYAHCLFSDFWSPLASSWVDRCHLWPPPHVVDDILRSGCHFVAIGHRLGSGNHDDNEWRVSFSQAEQKLVYAMNHTQFLTYGLLKLFLKEINNGLAEEEKLLSSYHMKIIVFWAIQQNTIAHWCPQNLLAGFWVCFKLLLKWVYEGVCPHLFIPENNLFLNKVQGVAQSNLFTQLYGLYEKGISFLLQSPSISSYIMDVLCNPRLSICTDEHTLISEVELDTELFNEIHKSDTLAPVLHLNWCIKYIHTIKQLIRSPLTQYEVIMSRKLTATILQTSAFMLHDMYINTSRDNKNRYIVDKSSCYMLKLAAKFGLVPDLLYIAMYYYKTFRHREALSVIEMTKVKLAQPGLMYRPHVDPERYTEAVGGQSWSYKMRHAVAYEVKLDNTICYINELKPEQQSNLQPEHSALYIPPFILLQMLEFLSCRHVDPVRAQAALDDLQVLVHHDQGIFVPVRLRDISWQILGICQQITGDHQAALYSYQQSLGQYPANSIQTATRHRIQSFH